MKTDYNRYKGNSGRYIRVPSPEKGRPAPAPIAVPAAKAPPPPRPVKKPPWPLAGLESGLGGFLDKLNINKLIGGFETEDLLLLLILYLLYRESGDTEMLLIMGAMFLGDI